jgi:hypothetical protein
MEISLVSAAPGLKGLEDSAQGFALRPIVLVVDLSVVARARVLLVLPRKSHCLSAERRGYKAGRFTYCASERRPGGTGLHSRRK